MTLISKTQLRNQMLSSRDELDIEFIKRASAEIQRRVMLLDDVRLAKRVGLYAPKKGDVLTDDIYRQLKLERKEVYYPVVTEDSLVCCRVNDLEELKPRDDGLFQPCLGKRELRDLNDLDIVFVPGLAFDLRGNRLGFGGGRWDRCLENFRGRRIALVFDFQVVAELPHSVRGRKVDVVVTESRIILN